MKGRRGANLGLANARVFVMAKQTCPPAPGGLGAQGGQLRRSGGRRGTEARERRVRRAGPGL